MLQKTFLRFEQGTIVSANILFSDQLGIKRRPALIISNSDYNNRFRDVVVLRMTSSREKEFPYNVDVNQTDLTEGRLWKDTTLMTDFIMLVEKENVMSKIGKLSQEKLLEVKNKMKELFAL